VDELEREPKKEKLEVPGVDLGLVEEAMQGDETEWVGPYGV
jgi:hypothetical protein